MDLGHRATIVKFDAGGEEGRLGGHFAKHERVWVMGKVVDGGHKERDMKM